MKRVPQPANRSAVNLLLSVVTVIMRLAGCSGADAQIIAGDAVAVEARVAAFLGCMWSNI